MSLLNGILLAVAALIIGIIIGRFTVRSRMPDVWNKS